MKKFDIAVLGGGPGGYVAAIRGAQLGKKVCIIEKEKLGGICLNWGCIPTKALLKNAELLNQIKSAELYGINVGEISVDFKKNIQRSRDVADGLSKGIEFLMKKNKISHIHGTGKIVSENSLEVTNDLGKEVIEAENIIIATGARPKTFPGMELDRKRIISSKEAMLLDQPPKDMIVIGSGAIGCEFAYFYNTFGTNVHILELADNILPLEDDEISKELKKSFNKNGIKVSLSTKVLKLESSKTKVRVLVETNNVQSYLESEIALLAVGVIGNIEGIGLNNIGIKTSTGKIDINDYNQTSIPNIYAIGDVSGPPWLAHRASAQANITIRHILGLTAKPLDSSEIPSCTYCQPQVASLGLTELQAKKEGHDIKIGKASFQSSGKALAIGKPEGFVKLIFDSKYGELIGAHIIGIEATELIAELGIAKALESTVEDLAFNIHAHPTLSESIMEAALDALGTPVHH